MKQNRNNSRTISRLRHKYKLVLMDAGSYEEKFSFRLTRLGVFSVAGALVILLVFLTLYLVAFTSLREYIPGYADVNMPKKVYELQQRADSLETIFRQQTLYITNLKQVLLGKEVSGTMPPGKNDYVSYDTITMTISAEDSLLRAEFEQQSKYNLNQNQTRSYRYAPADLGNMNFFPPIKGIVTRSFNSKLDHYGVDIVAKSNSAIKAVLDGTVIFSDWTLQTGYIIGLQHKNNLISVYKHNSSLLKQEGAYVKAGETISIVGASGELSTGPHLHFELWHNGSPVNPEEFIAF
ncbi:MAG TPA: M23 family metallopeptidase [Bacteroidales bacterium]|nr:M23 family metallopeptidase [Bacteroidales bacterium]